MRGFKTLGVEGVTTNKRSIVSSVLLPTDGRVCDVVQNQALESDGCLEQQTLESPR